MRANLLIKPGQIELREIETPSPNSGEVVVKVKVALTCGTDLKTFLRGHPKFPLPALFGHEFSGEVASVGRCVRKLREDDTVVVIGSGAIGLLHLLALQAFGLEKIIMLGRRSYRLQLAKELGAYRVIDTREGITTEMVYDLTEGRGADIVVECTGN